MSSYITRQSLSLNSLHVYLYHPTIKVHVNLEYVDHFPCLYYMVQTKPQVHVNLKSMST